jgi:hypothetical protein
MPMAKQANLDNFFRKKKNSITQPAALQLPKEKKINQASIGATNFISKLF